MESSRGGGRGDRPRDFDRDLDVDLDFDPFAGSRDADTGAPGELKLPSFVEGPLSGEAPEEGAAPPPTAPERSRERARVASEKRASGRPEGSSQAPGPAAGSPGTAEAGSQPPARRLGDPRPDPVGGAVDRRGRRGHRPRRPDLRGGHHRPGRDRVAGAVPDDPRDEAVHRSGDDRGGGHGRRRLLRGPVPDRARGHGRLSAHVHRRHPARVARRGHPRDGDHHLRRALDRPAAGACRAAARAAPPWWGAPRRRAGGDLRRRHRRVRGRAAVRPSPAGPEPVAEQDGRGAGIRLRRRHDGLLVRGPLPGLAPGARRPPDGDVHRDPGARRRPVRVDDQARRRAPRTRATCSARTAASSTAPTPPSSRSLPATTWRSRSCTELPSA